jgi:hypothetical protein
LRFNGKQRRGFDAKTSGNLLSDPYGNICNPRQWPPGKASPVRAIHGGWRRGRTRWKGFAPHNAIKFSGAGPAFQLMFARGMAGHQNTPAEGGRHFMLHPFSLLFEWRVFEWPVKSSHGDDLVIIAAC